MLENGDLVIGDVRWADNMGLYHCVAQNDVGFDRVDTFLYPVYKVVSDCHCTINVLVLFR